jgi:serine/threonine protein kinase
VLFTDKWLSIHRYARVAELGKGVHGKVWLCEDTDTGEFFAIKSVNREDRRNKSLKREQAEATARERALADAEQNDQDDEELEEERRQRLRAENPNASFDEQMQLDEPLPQITRKKSTTAARKTMMDEKVKQEIAIMKRIHHPNVVQLREVIDDIRSKKIFMGRSVRISV